MTQKKVKPWQYISDDKIKFKREHLLNHGTNRWHLNQSKNVGKTSELIRNCEPKFIEDWKDYYFIHAYQNRKPPIKVTNKIIKEHGINLHTKLSEIVSKEIDLLTEDECIDYIKFLIINRTFDGYEREIDTIYGQLEKELSIKIEPATNDIDRRLNVDFIITIKKYYIGLQIKPKESVFGIPQIYKEKGIQVKSHIAFTKKYTGAVFYIYSIKKEIFEKKKLIEDIKKEISRLKKL